MTFVSTRLLSCYALCFAALGRVFLRSHKGSRVLASQYSSSASGAGCEGLNSSGDTSIVHSRQCCLPWMTVRTCVASRSTYYVRSGHGMPCSDGLRAPCSLPRSFGGLLMPIPTLAIDCGHCGRSVGAEIVFVEGANSATLQSPSFQAPDAQTLSGGRRSSLLSPGSLSWDPAFARRPTRWKRCSAASRA